MTDVHAALRYRLPRRRMGAISLAESHDRMVAQGLGPVQAGQGRKPATPVVHSASLDGPAARHGFVPCSTRGETREVRIVSTVQ
jgi:hypothetical protein